MNVLELIGLTPAASVTSWSIRCVRARKRRALAAARPVATTITCGRQLQRSAVMAQSVTWPSHDRHRDLRPQAFWMLITVAKHTSEAQQPCANKEAVRSRCTASMVEAVAEEVVDVHSTALQALTLPWQGEWPSTCRSSLSPSAQTKWFNSGGGLDFISHSGCAVRPTPRPTRVMPACCKASAGRCRAGPGP